MTLSIPFFANLRAARAPIAAFFAMGLCWGSFAADLPDIKTMLAVDEAHLGALLFLTPVAAVTAMLLAPVFARLAGPHALTWCSMAMALAFLLPGQVAVVWVFPFAMMACGAGTGMTDVVMNARVSALEAAGGHSLMNLCHAAYSFGYAGGAMGTGALREAGWPPSSVLSLVAVIAAAVTLLTYERDGRIDGLSRPKGQGASRLGPVPVIGGAMVLIAFLTENASENWSALHIEKTLGGSPADGAMGPSVMALTMGIARLVGQGFAQRVAPVRLLGVAAVVAACGMGIAAAALSPAMAYVGFIVAGLGASLIAPTAFSMVGAYVAPRRGRGRWRGPRCLAISAISSVRPALGFWPGPLGFG